MPFSHSFIEPLDLVVVKAEGRLTPAGLYACVEAYHAHPAFHAETNLLFDIGETVEVVIAGEADGEAAAERDATFLDEVGRIVRDVRGEAVYKAACAGGAKETQTFFLAGIEMANRRTTAKAFATRPAALGWLGVSASEAAQHGLVAETARGDRRGTERRGSDRPAAER